MRTRASTDQDAAIAGDAHKAGRGIIIAANKWDLMKEQGPTATRSFDEQVRYQLKFLDYAPILHISAKTGERTPKLLETIDRVAASRRLRVADAGAESLHRADHQRTSAGESRAPQRARAVRGADRRRAADVRAVHERRDEAAFFLRAVSREPAARGVSDSSERRSGSPSASDRAAVPTDRRH